MVSDPPKVDLWAAVGYLTSLDCPNEARILLLTASYLWVLGGFRKMSAMKERTLVSKLAIKKWYLISSLVIFAIENEASIWRNQISGSSFQNGRILMLLAANTGVAPSLIGSSPFIFWILGVDFLVSSQYVAPQLILMPPQSRRGHQIVGTDAHK